MWFQIPNNKQIEVVIDKSIKSLNTYGIQSGLISNQTVACKHSQKSCKGDCCSKCMFYVMNVDFFDYRNSK